MTTQTVHQKQDSESDKYTSIRVSRQTLKKLETLGRFKESYADLVDRLVSEKLGLAPNASDGGSF